MNIRTLLSAMSVAGCLSALAIEVPVPLVTELGAKKGAVEALDKGEVSLACEVKFGSLPSKGAVTGLFRLAADAEGRVSLTIPAAPTSLEGDLTLKSRETVKKGDWHQYAFSYSMMRKRIAFYIDGRLQFENDNVNLPWPGFGEPTVGVGFGGEIRNFKVYDIALESERLVYATPGDGSKTLWDVRKAKDTAALAARLEKEFADNPKAVKTDALAFYTTDPMSQVRLMPYMIPSEADFSGSLDVVAAQDEFEAGSLVVMARKPVKSFTVKMGDLVCGGEKISGQDVDIRLVKRWYRTGGAWFSYFADFRHRVLTPHLLVYDDALVKVDELRARNFYRLDYPEGSRYIDVSDPKYLRTWWNRSIPFKDAKTLQPIASLDEFGRNQQYWILFHAKKGQKPGVYRGALDLIADGKTVAKMPVNFRVLDFELPVRGASYDDLSRFYISHVNIQGSIIQGRTAEEMRGSALAELKSIRNHNSLDTNSIFDNPEGAKLAKEAGFPTDEIWAELRVPRWQDLFKGKKKSELTEADRKLGMRFAERSVKGTADYYDENFPGSRRWCLFYSESLGYAQLNVFQQDQSAIAHKLGWKVFAHGMSENNYDAAADSQDMQIQTSMDRKCADKWHAIDSQMAVYAKPFASPETPAVHRRLLGLGRYKGSHFDGNMQHGVMDNNANQFAPDPRGDGNYRCQIMLYPQYGGFLETICWEGVREGFDDVRYATVLKQLAWPRLQDENTAIRREARRALAWLENQDGNTASMQTVRFGIIDRILNLKALIAKGGK